MLRAASVPMVYDELAEYLKASAFDHEVRDAEPLQDDIEGNLNVLNVLNEIVES